VTWILNSTAVRASNVAWIPICFHYPYHNHRQCHQLAISPCVSMSFSTYFVLLFFHVWSPLACFDFKRFIYVQKLVSTYIIPSFSNGVKEFHFDVSIKKIGLLPLNELINKSALGRSYWTRPSESGPGMEVPVPGNVCICHKQHCSTVWALAGTATGLTDTSVIVKCTENEATANESTTKTENVCTVLTERNVEVWQFIMPYKNS